MKFHNNSDEVIQNAISIHYRKYKYWLFAFYLIVLVVFLTLHKVNTNYVIGTANLERAIEFIEKYAGIISLEGYIQNDKSQLEKLFSKKLNYKYPQKWANVDEHNSIYLRELKEYTNGLVNISNFPDSTLVVNFLRKDSVNLAILTERYKQRISEYSKNKPTGQWGNEQKAEFERFVNDSTDLLYENLLRNTIIRKIFEEFNLNAMEKYKKQWLSKNKYNSFFQKDLMNFKSSMEEDYKRSRDELTNENVKIPNSQIGLSNKIIIRDI